MLDLFRKNILNMCMSLHSPKITPAQRALRDIQTNFSKKNYSMGIFIVCFYSKPSGNAVARGVSKGNKTVATKYLCTRIMKGINLNGLTSTTFT